MNEFISPAALRDYGVAAAAVVALTNLALMLGGERLRAYAGWVAGALALVIALAAQGLPTSFAAGVATVVSAGYLTLAALGANTAITDTLAARQPQTRGGELVASLAADDAGAPRPAARFWRKW